LEYLYNWKQLITNPNDFLTIQTYKGLVVTLKGTLELVKHICDEVGYKYFMTRRINQDALEVKLSIFLQYLFKRYINIKYNISASLWKLT